MSVDLVYYGDLTDKNLVELTIKYAQIFAGVDKFIASNDPNDINTFLFRGLSDKSSEDILFIGGPAKCSPGLAESIDKNLDYPNILTFNVCDLQTNFFEPIEPSYCHRRYFLSLNSCRGVSVNGGIMRCEHPVNHIFAIKRGRIADFEYIDSRALPFINLYFSFCNLHRDIYLDRVSGRTVIDTDITVAIKEPKLVTGSNVADFLGQKFIKNYENAAKLISSRHIEYSPLKGSIEIESNASKFEYDLLRLRNNLGEKCSIINNHPSFFRKIPSDAGIIISSDAKCFSAPDVGDSYESSWTLDKGLYVTYSTFKSVIAEYCKSSLVQPDGLVFAPPFSNYGDTDILCLQVAGFLGFKEIVIYEDRSDNKFNYVKLDPFIDALRQSGVNIVRHILC